MYCRALLIAALFVSPAWSQEPASEAPVLTAQRLDLQSDTVKKIVRETAASQYSNVQVTQKAPVSSGPKQFVYVPPEAPPAPVREAPKQKPAPATKASSFVSSVFEFLIDEALDSEEDDGVTDSNEMLRCRIQKEQKTSPPGIDNCPTAD